MQSSNIRLFRDPGMVPAGVFPQGGRGCVVAMGNFDGMHRGHLALLDAARVKAEALGAPFGVVTFEPHPRRLFRPDDPPFRLQSWRRKVASLAAAGVTVVYQLRFRRALSEMPGERFVREVLHRDLGVAGVVVGADFRFGHGRDGDGALLQRLGGELGFAVELVAPVGDGESYSSSRARQALRAGDVATAEAVLGRPWEVDGRVMSGDQRGRAIGFATANIGLGDTLRPRYGVYAVRACVDDGTAPVWRDGVANLGVRPTVDGARELLEVHLLDWQGDLYGQRLRVAFVEFIRGEQKFDGLDALKRQIGKDCTTARSLLKASA